jgi:hypothetical protein
MLQDPIRDAWLTLTSAKFRPTIQTDLVSPAVHSDATSRLFHPVVLKSRSGQKVPSGSDRDVPNTRRSLADQFPNPTARPLTDSIGRRCRWIFHDCDPQFIYFVFTIGYPPALTFSKVRFTNVSRTTKTWLDLSSEAYHQPPHSTQMQTPLHSNAISNSLLLGTLG